MGESTNPLLGKYPTKGCTHNDYCCHVVVKLGFLSGRNKISKVANQSDSSRRCFDSGKEKRQFLLSIDL